MEIGWLSGGLVRGLLNFDGWSWPFYVDVLWFSWEYFMGNIANSRNIHYWEDHPRLSKWLVTTVVTPLRPLVMWNTLGGTSEPGWTSYWYCDAERPHQTWLLLGKPSEMAKQVNFESCLSLKWRRLCLLNKPAYDLKKLHDKLNKLATTCQQFGRLAAQGWDKAIAKGTCRQNWKNRFYVPGLIAAIDWHWMDLDI